MRKKPKFNKSRDGLTRCSIWVEIRLTEEQWEKINTHVGHSLGAYNSVKEALNLVCHERVKVFLAELGEKP